uniref:Uncharacterized protein n=1 Tax=viral metagenome TaxID=1070528 RepID=A0A6M3XX02_9ZZZZ
MLNRKLKVISLILCIVLIMGMVAYAEYQPFKVKLNLFERLVCMALLPAEGSFATLKIVRELQMELAPTEEEYKLAGLKDDLLTGGINAELGWDKVEDKEIVFGDIAKAIIVSALKKLDEAEKLTQQHFSLYEKFVIGEKKEGE